MLLAGSWVERAWFNIHARSTISTGRCWISHKIVRSHSLPFHRLSTAHIYPFFLLTGVSFSIIVPTYPITTYPNLAVERLLDLCGIPIDIQLWQRLSNYKPSSGIDPGGTESMQITMLQAHLKTSSLIQSALISSKVTCISFWGQRFKLLLMIVIWSITRCLQGDIPCWFSRLHSRGANRAIWDPMKGEGGSFLLHQHRSRITVFMNTVF